jgi:hypothetical protein
MGTTELTRGSLMLDRVGCRVRRAGLVRPAGPRDGLRKDNPERARKGVEPRKKKIEEGKLVGLALGVLRIHPKASLEIKKPLFIA